MPERFASEPAGGVTPHDGPLADWLLVERHPGTDGREMKSERFNAK